MEENEVKQVTYEECINLLHQKKESAGKEIQIFMENVNRLTGGNPESKMNPDEKLEIYAIARKAAKDVADGN